MTHQNTRIRRTQAALYPSLGMISATLIATQLCNADGLLTRYCIDAEDWNLGKTAGELTWHDAGGNGGGHIQARDLDSGVMTLYAPTAFLGDLTAFDGSTLSFDLRQVTTNENDYREGLGNLTIVGATGSVTVDIITNVLPSDWTTYSIQLTAAAWGLNQPDWISLLSNVTEISMDVDSYAFFEDTVGIDNPKIGTVCLNDLNDDGAVGVDDLLQLLAAWGTDDAFADIDCDGTVGVDDLLLVLAAWGPCP